MMCHFVWQPVCDVFANLSANVLTKLNGDVNGAPVSNPLATMIHNITTNLHFCCSTVSPPGGHSINQTFHFSVANIELPPQSLTKAIHLNLKIH